MACNYDLHRRNASGSVYHFNQNEVATTTCMYESDF